MIEGKQSTHPIRWLLVALLVGGLAACSADVDPGADGSRSELDRKLDLALAGTGAEPEFRDVGTPVVRPLPPSPQPPGPADAQAEASNPAPEEPPPPEPPPSEPQVEAPPEAPAPAPEEQPEAETAEQPEPLPEQPETQPEEPGADAPGADEFPESDVAMVTVPTGTSFQITLRQELNTHYSRVGDYFMSTITDPIMDGDRELVPAGATVLGRITRVQQPDRSGNYGLIEIQLDRIIIDDESYPISATITQTQLETRTVKSGGSGRGGAAARGAITGAILGRILGGRGTKGVLVGAAAGAAAGAARGGGGGGIGTDAILAVGSQVSCILDAPLVIQQLFSRGATE